MLRQLFCFFIILHKYNAILNPKELLVIDFSGPIGAFIFHMQLMKLSRPLTAVTEISHKQSYTPFPYLSKRQPFIIGTALAFAAKNEFKITYGEFWTVLM